MKLEILHVFPNMPGVKYPMRVFMGLLPTEDGGYGGLLREHSPERCATDTDLRRVKFDSEFKLVEDSFLCRADDCRLFGWGAGQVFGLTYLVRPDGNGLDYFVANVSVPMIAKLIFPVGRFIGKNLVPLVMGEDLHIIQRIWPLVIWKVDKETGVCTKLWGEDIGNNGIGGLRGGSAAECNGERIRGWGHYTRNENWHTPFYYEVDQSEFSIEHIEDMEGINDPTSAWDDKLLVCHTEKAWTVNQPCEHRLYRVVR